MNSVAAHVGTLPLRRRWAGLRECEPGLRARDAARRLGVSEAELIASACGENAVRLAPREPERLIEALAPLGPVLALTRNEHVVIEKTGPIEQIEIHHGHGVGSVIGKAIDLRLFLRRWVHAFAVTETTRKEPRRSLQCFDEHGVAVHKLYLTERSDVNGFQRLVNDFAAADQSTLLTVSSAEPPARARSDDAVDVEGLRTAWAGLRDTHEFFALLRRFGVRRLQALRLAGAHWAWPVVLDAHRRVLERARDIELPIMAFVASPGTVQIHTGPVHRLAVVGEWYNVLDPDFNLHLRETGVASAWVVRKPTVDGEVTGLELFDDRGEPLLQCFGKRKGGQRELTDWRRILEQLPALES